MTERSWPYQSCYCDEVKVKLMVVLLGCGNRPGCISRAYPVAGRAGCRRCSLTVASVCSPESVRAPDVIRKVKADTGTPRKGSLQHRKQDSRCPDCASLPVNQKCTD